MMDSYVNGTFSLAPTHPASLSIYRLQGFNEPVAQGTKPADTCAVSCLFLSLLSNDYIYIMYSHALNYKPLAFSCALPRTFPGKSINQAALGLSAGRHLGIWASPPPHPSPPVGRELGRRARAEILGGVSVSGSEEKCSG